MLIGIASLGFEDEDFYVRTNPATDKLTGLKVH